MLGRSRLTPSGGNGSRPGSFIPLDPVVASRFGRRSRPLNTAAPFGAGPSPGWQAIAQMSKKVVGGAAIQCRRVQLVPRPLGQPKAVDAFGVVRSGHMLHIHEVV